MRSPIPWHGGKSRMVKKLIKRFPDHSVYLEPFGGGASILLSKPPAKVETYNDLNGKLTRFFRALRDDGDEIFKDWRTNWFVVSASSAGGERPQKIEKIWMNY